MAVQMRVLSLWIVALLAGCTVFSPPQTSRHFVAASLNASTTTIHPGDELNISLLATNRGASTLWTYPGISCRGSWDIWVESPNGTRLRDIRDLDKCADSGPMEIPWPAGGCWSFNHS